MQRLRSATARRIAGAVRMGRRYLPLTAGLLVVALLPAARAAGPVPPTPAGPSAEVARQLQWELVRRTPHDPDAYLQGLVWYDGGFFESTGRYGHSSLRRVEWPSGRVLRRVDLPPDVFGEGLARVGNRLVQLTWRNGRGLVYDVATLKLLQEFRYEGEGWGLTYDGARLILSDGTDVLTYLDPERFTPTRKLGVTWNGQPVRNLNELEFIDGRIWANIWYTDLVVQISPASGRVTSYLDLTSLGGPEPGPEGAVLNGIAYDPATRRVWLGGKLWPTLFEIRVR